MKKIFVHLFSGEVFFTLYLTAGFFKPAITFLPIDVTILFFGLSMLTVLKRIIINKIKISGSTLSIYLFLLFMGMMMASYLYTIPGSSYATDKLLRFVLTSWSFIGCFFLFRTRESIQKMLATLVGVSAVMCYDSIFNYLHRQRELGFTTAFGSDNYLSLAYQDSVAVIIIMQFMFSKKPLFGKNFLSVLAILALCFSILISGGRMPLISLCIILMIMFLMNIINFEGRKVMISKNLKKIIVTGILAASIIVPLGKAGAFITFEDRFNLFFQSDKGESVNSRLDRYHVAYKMIGESPILGKGIGSFASYYSLPDVPEWPHNIFLEIWAEMGMIGLVIFLALLSHMTYRGFVLYRKKNGKFDSMQYVLIFCFIYLLMTALTGGSLNERKLMFAFMALICISPVVKYEIDGIKKINK